MESTAFDGDEILTDFLTDYIDGNLDRTERTAFQEYLKQNEREREFARKVRQGKHALNMLAGMLKTAEDRQFRHLLKKYPDKRLSNRVNH